MHDKEFVPIIKRTKRVAILKEKERTDKARYDIYQTRILENE